MILVVLLVLALFILQTLLPNRFREPAPDAPSPRTEALGNRDHQRPLTIVGGRAERALANMQEALPVFLALALMNMIAAPGAGIALTGAWVFVIARTIYVPIYLAGVRVVRTLCWAAGVVGLAMMVAPLLDRV
jgi:uncharacterized MAPEG superfamily protein